MKRVLIVEDNPSDAKIMTFFLEKKGMHVTQSGDAYKALDLLKRYDFDLIIMDWMLPHMNGLDALKTIRSDSKKQDIPVIFTTSRSEARDIKKAIDAGVTDYIVKPVEADVLFNKIKRSLKQDSPLQFFKIPFNEGGTSVLQLKIKLVELSEKKLKFMTSLNITADQVVELQIPIFEKLGITKVNVKTSASTSTEEGYLVEADLFDLDSEQMFKIRTYLHSLEQEETL